MSLCVCVCDSLILVLSIHLLFIFAYIYIQSVVLCVDITLQYAFVYRIHVFHSHYAQRERFIFLAHIHVPFCVDIIYDFTRSDRSFGWIIIQSQKVCLVNIDLMHLSLWNGNDDDYSDDENNNYSNEIVTHYTRKRSTQRKNICII